MTTPSSPSDPKAPGTTAATAHPVDSFAEKLQHFWERNRTAFLTGCTLVLLGILGKGAYEIYVGQHEAGIEKEFAAAATPEKLKAFAADHAGHSLAGIAYLRLADDAYAAGKFADAITNYDLARGSLKDQPLAGRARLGSAMARLLSGQTADGVAALKQLADDTTALKGLRVEAAYHLATNAADAGKADEVQKFTDQIMQIDGNSVWAQRAMMLRATSALAAAAKPATPAASAAPAPTPEVGIKLPGKN